MKTVRVVGAGLAGCEAAWQIARRGVAVELYEMKPARFSSAHRSEALAELVCSNSFKAEREDSASGLLKREMRRLGSLLLPCADRCRVPAGGALAVDRDAFSAAVTEAVASRPRIRLRREEVTRIPEDGVAVLATGPLTSDALAVEIEKLCGKALAFYDAAAPIVTAESLDRNRIFPASRYGKGEGDAYLNCPMDREEYERFYAALISAERAPLRGFDEADPQLYEGCMPVEEMAGRGKDTLRFGPMKPVGLRDPATGRRPWAVLQLRREDARGTLYNLVGFQTHLKFGEQKRVFGMIPGLAHAEFVRYGVMHRNTFLDSPRVLAADFSVRARPNLFFAGQITGVEGYMESASSGILAGINAARRAGGEPAVVPPAETMCGALSLYAAGGGEGPFQPMGANFGILPPLDPPVRDKRERYAALARRALGALEQTIREAGL